MSTRAERVRVAGRQGESNHGSRFDTPELRRAMSRCIHAGNPKWTAVQLGLDYTTVCAWGQRHPNAPPGVDRPRLNGPAKQLAILMDGALVYGRDEEHRDDALAPLHWLAGAFGGRFVDEAVEPARSEVEASALLLKSAGGLVEHVLSYGVGGYSDSEREELTGELHGLVNRARELELLLCGPKRRTRLESLRGGKR